MKEKNLSEMYITQSNFSVELCQHSHHLFSDLSSITRDGHSSDTANKSTSFRIPVGSCTTSESMSDEAMLLRERFFRAAPRELPQLQELLTKSKDIIEQLRGTDCLTRMAVRWKAIDDLLLGMSEKIKTCHQNEKPAGNSKAFDYFAKRDFLEIFAESPKRDEIVCNPPSALLLKEWDTVLSSLEKHVADSLRAKLKGFWTLWPQAVSEADKDQGRTEKLYAPFVIGRSMYKRLQRKPDAYGAAGTVNWVDANTILSAFSINDSVEPETFESQAVKDMREALKLWAEHQMSDSVDADMRPATELKKSETESKPTCIGNEAQRLNSELLSRYLLPGITVEKPSLCQSFSNAREQLKLKDNHEDSTLGPKTTVESVTILVTLFKTLEDSLLRSSWEIAPADAASVSEITDATS